MLKQSFSDRLTAGSAGPASSGGGRVWPALAAAVLWLAAGLSAGYWLLQFWGRGPLTPVSAIASNPIRADAASVARALGAVPEAALAAVVTSPVPSRFRLIGLVSQPGQRGAALIAVDGRPPRPVTIGAVVDGDWVLQSVGRHGVRIGVGRDGPGAMELTLPSSPP